MGGIDVEIHELGEILHKMYFDSGEGEAVVMIHLFGVKYADEINALNASGKAIAKAAGIRESYGTEIRKGVNLAKYVQVKTA